MLNLRILENILKTAAVIVPLTIGGIVLYKLDKMSDEEVKFHEKYHKALFQYADTNRDGLISSAERDEFDRDLLKDKNVRLVVGNMPQYLNGKIVPSKIITKWLEDYKPGK